MRDGPSNSTGSGCKESQLAATTMKFSRSGLTCDVTKPEDRTAGRPQCGAGESLAARCWLRSDSLILKMY